MRAWAILDNHWHPLRLCHVVFFLQHHFRLCWKTLLHCDLEALLYRKMFCSQLQTNDSSEMNSFQRRVPPVTLLRFAFLCKLLSPIWLNRGNVGAPQLLQDILRNQRNWQHHIIFKGGGPFFLKKSALDSFYWAEMQQRFQPSERSHLSFTTHCAPSLSPEIKTYSFDLLFHHQHVCWPHAFSLGTCRVHRFCRPSVKINVQNL